MENMIKFIELQKSQWLGSHNDQNWTMWKFPFPKFLAKFLSQYSKDSAWVQESQNILNLTNRTTFKLPFWPTIEYHSVPKLH